MSTIKRITQATFDAVVCYVSAYISDRRYVRGGKSQWIGKQSTDTVTHVQLIFTLWYASGYTGRRECGRF